MNNELYKDSLGFWDSPKHEQWYLLRCFKCEPNGGRENWSPAVATGQCAWCGYSPMGESDDGTTTN